MVSYLFRLKIKQKRIWWVKFCTYYFLQLDFGNFFALIANFWYSNQNISNFYELKIVYLKFCIINSTKYYGKATHNSKLSLKIGSFCICIKFCVVLFRSFVCTHYGIQWTIYKKVIRSSVCSWKGTKQWNNNNYNSRVHHHITITFKMDLFYKQQQKPKSVQTKIFRAWKGYHLTKTQEKVFVLALHWKTLV